jgi:hypothetical protein
MNRRWVSKPCEVTLEDGRRTDIGPFWYLHHPDGGSQHTLYLGRADYPESKVKERRHR